ncbi:hypothetical protein [Nonomuraea dietziae]|uniref:hypothetical protein n=1 Tax=Nonomuraea dietziae TaxID=65515 RepID=UPI0033CC14E4
MTAGGADSARILVEHITITARLADGTTMTIDIPKPLGAELTRVDRPEYPPARWVECDPASPYTLRRGSCQDSTLTLAVDLNPDPEAYMYAVTTTQEGREP